MNSTRSNLLVVSMILNLGLLLGIGYILSRPASPTDSQTAQEPASPAKTEKVQAPLNSGLPSPEKAIPKIWNLLEADDYPTFIANLRKIGCPDETIRLLVSAEINEKYNQQMQDMMRSGDDEFKFWATGMNPFGGSFGSKMSDIMALERARQDEVKAALGEMGVPSNSESWMYGGPAMASYLEQNLSFLPEGERDNVMDIYMQYQMKQSEIMMNANGVMLPSDQEAIRAIKQEMNEQLASLMTPEQKKELDLYMSDTANMMRSQLTGFNPTEDEFRSIFEIQQSFDEKYSNQYGMMAMTPEEQAAQNAARQEMERSIRETLGEERFQDYQKSQDYSYRTLAQLSDRLGLETGAADEVYGMQKDIQAAQNQVMGNAEMSMEERAAALREIAEESRSTVEGLLGEEGYNYYRNSGGYWLNQLDMMANSLDRQAQSFAVPQSTDAQVLDLVEEALQLDEPRN